MSQSSVLLQVKDHIATVTLNRPQALNAINDALNEDFGRIIRQVELDDEVRVLVLCGAGPHFMAGGDIKSFHEHCELAPEARRRLFDEFIFRAHDPIMRMRRMPKPIIASVHGAVAGYGLSLMLACDLVVAADNSYFTLAYRHIGTSPDGSSTYSLPRMVGLKRAMEIALLGERFDAATALQFGLVNRVVGLAQLSDSTTHMAKQLVNGPARALGRTKLLLNDALNHSLVEQLRREQDSFANCAAEPDFVEGLAAFMQKRQAQFNRISSTQD
ncbi:MAG: hypothetical protein RLZZ502_862 [Pseudomonadota bacterium]|jgi:2-(1,2-epoxy-1,2-dihydrophenyl)acetyl-CoA isomerase